MYFLELHGTAIEEFGRVSKRSFVRRLGGRSGFLSAGLLEAKLIRLCKEELDADWETAFAVTEGGVVAYWERDALHHYRTGEATDLELTTTVSRQYVSRRFTLSLSAGFICKPWDGQTPLKQVVDQVTTMWCREPELTEVVLFDQRRQRVGLALRNTSAPEVTPDGLWPIAIGEHIS